METIKTGYLFHYFIGNLQGHKFILLWGKFHFPDKSLSQRIEKFWSLSYIFQARLISNSRANLKLKL